MQIVIHDNTACTALSAFAMVSSCCDNNNGFSVSVTAAIAFLCHCGVVVLTLSSIAVRKVPLAFPGGEKEIRVLPHENYRIQFSEMQILSPYIQLLIPRESGTGTFLQVWRTWIRVFSCSIKDEWAEELTTVCLVVGPVNCSLFEMLPSLC